MNFKKINENKTEKKAFKNVKGNGRYGREEQSENAVSLNKRMLKMKEKSTKKIIDKNTCKRHIRTDCNCVSGKCLIINYQIYMDLSKVARILGLRIF